jgi:putative tryptophan/tyrosine transport system substrate-binding protein
MKRTITVLALYAMLFALCTFAEAQQPGKIPRVGLVVANREATSVRVFQQGLQELGYVEGKNILFEYRYTERNLDRIPSLVAELVQLKVDVLLLTNFRAIWAAKHATQTIPVVMVTTQDPVETGIIDSLARPGGNITGLTRLTRDLSGKRLELLKEAVPKDIAGRDPLGC